MKIVPFENEHAAMIDLQDAQRGIEYEAVPPSPYGITAMQGGRPVFCGGMLKDEGVWMLWALVGRDAGPYLTRMFRIAARWMKEQPRDPVGMVIKTHFPQAHRLARLLGMEELETKPGMWPDGSSGTVYARMPVCST